LKKEVTVEAVNAVLKDAAEHQLRGILEYPEEETITIPWMRIKEIHQGQFGHLCLTLSRS